MEDFIQYNDINPIEPIDLSIFKDHIQKSLLNIISSLPKVEKRLILESSLIPKISFFINDISMLRNIQVKKEIYHMGKAINVDSEIMIFLIPSKLLYLVEILGIIDKYSKENEIPNEIEFHIIFVPTIDSECQSIIMKSLYQKLIKIHNLNIDIFTIDYDLMSLEDNNALKDLYIDHNYNCISILSRAILKFETVFGKIKYRYIKGNLAKQLYNSLKKDEEKMHFQSENEILGSFFLDRDIDFVTLFCSQGTYEGVIDEFFNINLNSIKIPPKLLEKDSKKDILKVDLGHSNKLYSLIKDYSFNKIRFFLPNRLLIYSKIIEEGRKETDLMKIQKGLEKVKLMKEERQSLTDNINIADYLSQKQKEPINRLCYLFEQQLLLGELPIELHEFYNNYLCKKNDKNILLRLICLESLCQSGIKSKYYDVLKRDYINTYGFQEIFLWKNLEKMNIIKKDDRSYIYYKANKKLNLICENVNMMEENDISYAYNGYSPIIIKLIEKCFLNGWNNLLSILDDLPGETYCPENENRILNPIGKNFILLVFIGGITYSEIGAIRSLNKKINNIKFIILTTHIITTKRFFQSVSTFNLEESEQMSFKEFYDRIKK